MLKSHRQLLNIESSSTTAGKSVVPRGKALQLIEAPYSHHRRIPDESAAGQRLSPPLAAENASAMGQVASSERPEVNVP